MNKSKVPTERLTLSCATLSVILPGIKNICAHVSGAKLESNLNPMHDDPILIRLSDRYSGKRFDQALARALLELKERLFALNRQGGGELPAGLSEVTMIAFAIRCREPRVRLTPRQKRFEKNLERLRKRLKRATKTQRGAPFYENFSLRWKGLIKWIRHKLQYEILSGARSRRSSARIAKPARRKTSKWPRIALQKDTKHDFSDPLEGDPAEWVKVLAEENGTILTEKELHRAVFFLKERGRKRLFDGYTLEDVLEEKARFKETVTRFLIGKGILIDQSRRQSANHAKMRPYMTVEPEEHEIPDSDNKSGTLTIPATLLPIRETSGHSEPSLVPFGAADDPAASKPAQVFPMSVQQAISSETALTSEPVKCEREELVRETAAFLLTEKFKSRKKIWVDLQKVRVYIPPKNTEVPPTIREYFRSVKPADSEECEQRMIIFGPDMDFFLAWRALAILDALYLYGQPEDRNISTIYEAYDEALRSYDWD